MDPLPATASEWIIDTEGYVECPECGERKKPGIAGVQNIQKNHIGSQICRTKAAKRSKAGKKLKNTSLLGFFGRSTPRHVVSTVSSVPVPQASPVHLENSQQLGQPPESEPDVSTNQNIPSVALRTKSAFMQRLKWISSNLPLNTPEATPESALAQFSDPGTVDNHTISSEDLWEELLNPILKGALGWGVERSMDTVLQRGKYGFSGLVGFVEYFTETRGVDEALFEGKLSQLVECAMKSIPSEMSSSNSKPQVDPSPVDVAPPIRPIHVIDLSNAEDSQVIEVFSEAARKLTNTPSIECPGFTLSIGSQSPYTTYPYGLHSLFSLPWSPYVDSNNIIRLYAHACDGIATGGQFPCPPCRSLKENRMLEGILARIEDGIAENTPYLYHGISGLTELLKRKSRHIETQHLQSLNHARALLGKATALDDYKRFLVAMSSGEVECVPKLVRIALGQKKGIKAILELLDRAAKNIYHPKSFSEIDELRGILLWRLGGNRLAYFGNKAFGTPGLSTLRNRNRAPVILASYQKPTTEEIEANILASFEDVMDVVQEQGKVIHAVLMFDEIATEKRIRLDPRKDVFLGVCREHGHRVSLDFAAEEDLVELFRALDAGEVHYAAEATVGALGLLCGNNRLYPARSILVSGDCKRETGQEHAVVLQTVLDSIKNQRDRVNIRITSIASDGEKRRGAAMAQLTFKNKLSPESKIFPLLSGLVFMDMHVGEDDLTCDKDWKHLFKRLRNLLLRERGIVIAGVRITPAILRAHFTSEGATTEHIRAMFNPEDLQDVSIALGMLKDIWTLPRESPAPKHSPGFQNTREALWTFGKFLYHLVFPFLGIELSLSEQLEHLSAAAHLSLILYCKAGKDFLPTELYTDIMIMIKNVFFCVAKMKIDIPDGLFWIVLLGTDRLEINFGVLRTMVGNNVNVDMYSLIERLSGTTEVANIFAKHPEWDRGPRRLKLPTLTRNGGELVARYDHITPAKWKGNVEVKNVTLLTSWRRGRRLIEDELPAIYADTLRVLEVNKNITILSPAGKLLVNTTLPSDDIDESTEEFISPNFESTQVPASTSDGQRDDLDSMIATELDSEFGGDTLDTLDCNIPPKPQKTRSVIYQGQKMSKTKALSLHSKYRQSVSSTDRLRRVQAIGRHFSARSSDQPAIRNGGQPSDLVLVIQDPVASLLRCDDRYWLCIGEVNGLKEDGQSVDFVNYNELAESTISVSFQLLGLRQADSHDDPTAKHDWRTYQAPAEASFTVPGRLIQTVNPDTSTPKSPREAVFYLFDSRVLVALAASIFQSLNTTDLKSVQKIEIRPDFPYRERLGKAAFLCQTGSDEEQLRNALDDPNMMACPLCTSPSVYLDLKQGQRVLEHLGAHILFDPKVSRTDEPCGLCLRPGITCLYHLTKAKGLQGKTKIDWDNTRSCPTKLTSSFSYSVASESSQTAPCSNVPLRCPSCPKLEAAVWRYNLRQHYQRVHPNVDHSRHAHQWELTNFEIESMKEIWKRRQRVVAKRAKKKTTVPPLVVSDAHRSQIPVDSTSKIKEHTEAVVSDSESVDDAAMEIGDAEGADETNQELDGRVGENNKDSDMGAGSRTQTENREMSQLLVLDKSVDSAGGDNNSSRTSSMPPPTRDLPANVSVFNSIESQPCTLVSDSLNPSTVANPPELASDSDGNAFNLAGREKRKRKVVEINGLSDCECGLPANPHDDDVVQCKRDGCETQWWHLVCVDLELAPKNWICRTCKASGGGRSSKSARR